MCVCVCVCVFVNLLLNGLNNGFGNQIDTYTCTDIDIYLMPTEKYLGALKNFSVCKQIIRTWKKCIFLLLFREKKNYFSYQDFIRMPSANKITFVHCFCQHTIQKHHAQLEPRKLKRNKTSNYNTLKTRSIKSKIRSMVSNDDQNDVQLMRYRGEKLWELN